VSTHQSKADRSCHKSLDKSVDTRKAGSQKASIFRFTKDAGSKPLVMTNIAIEKIAMYSGFTYWKWWFSIVMWQFTRGYNFHNVEHHHTLCTYHEISSCTWISVAEYHRLTDFFHASEFISFPCLDMENISKSRSHCHLYDLYSHENNWKSWCLGPCTDVIWLGRMSTQGRKRIWGWLKSHKSMVMT
jgi:hypothetical protein